MRWKLPYHKVIAPTREVIAKRFPAAFEKRGNPDKRPLKIGIDKDLVAAMPEVNPEAIRAAVADYCTGPKYAKAMVAGAARIDLDGKPAGVVTEQQAAHSKRREVSRKKAAQAHAAKVARERAAASQTGAAP